MDPSSLIFVAIIAVWAAYLLGHWVRRRDQLATARSIDRFSHAMRVLERRAPAPVARPAARAYVVSPARVTPPAIAAPAAMKPAAAAPASRPAARPRPDRTAARAAAVRRRTALLAVLVVATAVAWPLVPLVGLPWWTAAAVTLGLLALVARLRSTARRQSRRAVTVRRRAATRAGREDVRSVVGQVVASRQDRLAAAGERAAAAAAPSPVVADEAAEPVVAGGWSPVPVPPPTYTLKPKAPARRVSAITVPQPEPAAAPVTFDLDEILERRIASGA